MKIKGFFFILLFSVFLITLFVVYQSRKCVRLGCLSFNGLNNYKLKDSYADDSASYKALCSNEKSGDLLKVEVRYKQEESQAQQYISSEVQKMKSLFANAPSPYPGDVSNEIACGNEFIPKYFEKDVGGVKLSYFFGNMNSRLTFGVCTQDQIAYRTYLVLFYCAKDKIIYNLEFVAPKASYDQAVYEKMLGSIKCQGPRSLLKNL